MIQSQNLLRYDEVLENLKERDLVFGCECSRKQVAKDLEAAGEIGLSYPGTCKNKQLPLQGPSTSLRLKTDAQPLGGLLLRNRNGAFSFDFCNVIDDQDQGIAHIIRGLDLLELEPRQEALGTLLFGSVHRKATYMYHPLIFQSKTQKLSKSLKGRSVESMLDAGWDTPSLIGYCAFLIGLSPNPRPMDFSEWVASGFQKLVQ